MNITNKDALIIIDVQNDFCPGGALAVNGGDEIVQDIVKFAQQFTNIVSTQDWHPSNHSSFAVNHGKEPFTQIDMPYGKQTLWPSHCVQGTSGAEFHSDLMDAVNSSNLIIRKGMNKNIDSYSAFFENDGVTTTGLAGYLKEHGIERVFLVGLAYDFCVAYSAIDAAKQGFKAVVIKDMCRAIAMPVDDTNTVEIMEEKMIENGVEIKDTAFKNVMKI